MERPTDFASSFARLYSQTPLLGEVYYAVSLLADEEGTRYVSIRTHWGGFEEGPPRKEIREPTSIDPFEAAEIHRHLGWPHAVVNDEIDLDMYRLSGGRGAVRAPLAALIAPDLAEPHPCVRSVTQGFVGLSNAPAGWLRRAPSKKARMRILKRDRRRCRVCGRSPDDFVDVTLHVHHIVPWSRSGLTEEDNLVTLCATCHDGLDPHYDPDLFRSMGFDPEAYLCLDGLSYEEGLRRYREGSLDILARIESGRA
jgi:hypothetical protein